MERIFVQIPSYRDPELLPTLHDLFEKAERPDRLAVAVCLQSIPEKDSKPPHILNRDHQIRYIRVDAAESRGVCWARHLIQQQWAGEEFVLQIDSHMRFEDGWDRMMIELLNVCPSKKPLLTTYPGPYIPPNSISRRSIPVIVPSHFDEHGTLLLGSIEIPLTSRPHRPIPGALCGTCFLFGPAEILSEVPYDPHVYFFGEEISLSVRLWTHGWDIFYPNIPVIYHYWERDYRPTHWDDVPDWLSMDTKSRRRVNHLLGIENATDEVLVDLKSYGLGNVRSLADYGKFTGIDFARRSVSNYRLTPALRPLEDEPLKPFYW
ncbi:MAG: hypothetical protein HY033_02445 [Ignavibacteriae bacterium]|nr:hypothetical protein [Ignavibacteria bacterium]MBI3363747.1 hypothetical protein [Ignavibacteriota bacterium]